MAEKQTCRVFSFPFSGSGPPVQQQTPEVPLGVHLPAAEGGAPSLSEPLGAEDPREWTRRSDSNRLGPTSDETTSKGKQHFPLTDFGPVTHAGVADRKATSCGRESWLAFFSDLPPAGGSRATRTLFKGWNMLAPLRTGLRWWVQTIFTRLLLTHTNAQTHWHTGTLAHWHTGTLAHTHTHTHTQPPHNHTHTHTEPNLHSPATTGVWQSPIEPATCTSFATKRNIVT